MSTERIANLIVTSVRNADKEISKSTTLQGFKIELEARIGVTIGDENKREFETCKRYYWYKLKDIMFSYEIPMKVTNITSISFGYHPQRVRIRSRNGVTKTYLEEKILHFNVDEDKIHWIRYSISAEKKLNSMDVGENVEKFISRHLSKVKNYKRHDRTMVRYSFAITDYLRLDMSHILSTGQFEVELELLKPTNNLDKIKELITYARLISKWSRGTLFLYSREILTDFITLINTNLQKSEDGSINIRFVDRRIFNDVRTLKRNDVKAGSIAGGRTIYSVSHKTDGLRMQLVLSGFGIWLMFPPFYYNLIIPDSYKFMLTKELTILDGELIPEDKQRRIGDAKYYYQYFDCLMCQGIDIQHFKLVERCSYAKQFIGELVLREGFPSKLIRIDGKSQYELTLNNFFRVIKRMWLERNNLSYKTDGFIFTPSNHKYFASVNYKMINTDRTIDDMPEILKWKSPEDTTIDFRVIKRDDGEIELLISDRTSYTDDDKDAMEFKFEGDDRNPFDPKTMIDKRSLAGISSGSIVEMEFKDKKFIFKTMRDEKAGPNRKDVAESNWRNINLPLSAQGLMGENLELMRNSHNRIKSKLLSNFDGVLLDIGSGKGGDIDKWSKFDTVICVEIKPEHIAELWRRATHPRYNFIVVREGEINTRQGKRIVIIEGSAIESDKIYKEVIRYAPNGVDVVSLMDVGTYLWDGPGTPENPSTLEKVFKRGTGTIDRCLCNGGTFLWKMMDGDEVRVKIDKQLNSEAKPEDNTLKIGDFELDYTYTNGQLDNKVKVTIPGGVTTGIKQEEYLTRIGDMYYYLNDYIKNEEEVANKEMLMGNDAKMVSELYKYGSMTKPGIKPQTFARSQTYNPTSPSVGREQQSPYRGIR